MMITDPRADLPQCGGFNLSSFSLQSEVMFVFLGERAEPRLLLRLQTDLLEVTSLTL